MASSPSNSPSSILEKPFWLWLAGLLVAVVFFKNAWVCEDAYINFRSLDQLFAGNGPNWNAHIRVQVYTSALWYWASAFIGVFIGDYFLASIILSSFCCATAAYFVWRLVKTPFTLFVFALIFVSSRTLADYSSSGLENPLAYALIAAFVFYLYFLQGSTHTSQHLIFTKLCVLMGFAPLVRHDLAILLIAPFLYACFLYRQKNKAFFIGKKNIAWLISPLALWTLFSLIYYGYPFPNTAYAKLNTGIDRIELIERGFSYFQAHLVWDSVILIILAIATTAVLFAKKIATKFLSVGLILYLAYLVYIGSDYMLGRLLATPTLLSLLIISKLEIAPSKFFRMNLSLIGISILSLFLLVKDPTNNPLFTSSHWGFQKGNLPMPILDNFDVRFGEYPSNSLWAYLKNKEQNSITQHNWCQKGLEAKDKDVVVRGPVGMFGFCAGRNVIIVDQWGITDPLLSRMFTTEKKWRPGHFTRTIPSGYLESLKSNKNNIVDENLSSYYDQVKKITDGKQAVFSVDRLLSIVKMNLGMYRKLISKAGKQADPA